MGLRPDFGSSPTLTCLPNAGYRPSIGHRTLDIGTDFSWFFRTPASTGYRIPMWIRHSPGLRTRSVCRASSDTGLWPDTVRLHKPLACLGPPEISGRPTQYIPLISRQPVLHRTPGLFRTPALTGHRTLGRMADLRGRPFFGCLCLPNSWFSPHTTVVLDSIFGHQSPTFGHALDTEVVRRVSTCTTVEAVFPLVGLWSFAVLGRTSSRLRPTVLLGSGFLTVRLELSTLVI